MHAAINRCRALCSLDLLSGPLRAAIVPADNVPHSEGSLGWREWPPPAAAARGDLSAERGGAARLLGRMSAAQLGAVGNPNPNLNPNRNPKPNPNPSPSPNQVGAVRGALSLVHGVPASGKASVLAAVAASRTPAGAMVLVVASSGHKLVSYPLP